MRFNWHCRECDARGEAEITSKDLVTASPEKNFFAILVAFVRRTIHPGCEGDIGVSAKSNG